MTKKRRFPSQFPKAHYIYLSEENSKYAKGTAKKGKISISKFINTLLTDRRLAHASNSG